MKLNFKEKCMAHRINHYILLNDKVYMMHQGINYHQTLVDHMV